MPPPSPFRLFFAHAQVEGGTLADLIARSARAGTPIPRPAARGYLCDVTKAPPPAPAPRAPRTVELD